MRRVVSDVVLHNCGQQTDAADNDAGDHETIEHHGLFSVEPLLRLGVLESQRQYIDI